MVGGGAAAVAVLIVVLGASVSPLWLLLLVPALAIGGLGVLFFRNPRRRIPAEPGIFVAPADGHVTEVGNLDEPEYIGGPAAKIGIFLSIFDVHLNRAPCAGKVEHLRHREGRYLDARDKASSQENECRSIGILRDEGTDPRGIKVLVRQIAGAIARRIVCPLEIGDSLERGRLLGMIKFGSRTELVVAVRPGDPPLEVLVKPGDKVLAGETVLLRFRG
jgi:phosphatidylserine decarboxylase